MSDWKAPNSSFKEDISQSFQRHKIHETLGIILKEVDVGRVVAELPFDPKLTQQHGYIHAGVAATAMDTCCSCAAQTLQDKGRGC